MNNAQHWERVYRAKSFDAVSWYAPHLRESLDLLERLVPDRTAAIIDVGGGESTLVDDLLDRRYTNVSVLDISKTAIDFTRSRLGSRANAVTWHFGDVTRFDFADHQYDVWHDRAVFHFLTAEADRLAYVAQVRRHVRQGGHVVMATFGPRGPLRCSDLDVVRYDAHRLIGSRITEHLTPANRNQEFLYCWCRVT
jgi:SAM-dependent methyltransferase